MNLRYRAFLITLSSACLSLACHAADEPAIRFDNGLEAGASGIFQYGRNVFTHDRVAGGGHVFQDANGWRRQELDLFVRHQGVFEVTAGYDFAAEKWVDNYLALEGGAGKFRLGEFRTPVGWENAEVSGRATTFIEASLPVEAAYEGRRAGLDWTWTGWPHTWLQLAWFAPHDLNHDGAGRTLAARVVYTPVQRDRQVLHLGLALSRENRDDRRARWRARPEADLTPVRLVDTGTLAGVHHVTRTGAEAGWLNGPLLLQGEYLAMRTARDGSAASVDGHGWYASASWVLTGEPHTYKDTAFGNPAPTHPGGALEVALRYSTLDLDDSNVQGGREHDWTLGLNWYIDKYFKLQANDVYASSDRGSLAVDPHIYELRAQWAF